MKLSLKQERAIVALLSTTTVVDAAKQTGIGESTLRRWLSESTFRKELDEARRRVYAQNLSRLQCVSAEALEVLRRIMLDEGARPADRVNAARLLLDFGFRAEEVMDTRGTVGGGLPLSTVLLRQLVSNLQSIAGLWRCRSYARFSRSESVRCPRSTVVKLCLFRLNQDGATSRIRVAFSLSEHRSA